MELRRSFQINASNRKSSHVPKTAHSSEAHINRTAPQTHGMKFNRADILGHDSISDQSDNDALTSFIEKITNASLRGAQNDNAIHTHHQTDENSHVYNSHSAGGNILGEGRDWRVNGLGAAQENAEEGKHNKQLQRPRVGWGNAGVLDKNVPVSSQRVEDFDVADNFHVGADSEEVVDDCNVENMEVGRPQTEQRGDTNDGSPAHVLAETSDYNNSNAAMSEGESDDTSESDDGSSSTSSSSSSSSSASSSVVAAIMEKEAAGARKQNQGHNSFEQHSKQPEIQSHASNDLRRTPPLVPTQYQGLYTAVGADDDEIAVFVPDVSPGGLSDISASPGPSRQIYSSHLSPNTGTPNSLQGAYSGHDSGGSSRNSFVSPRPIPGLFNRTRPPNTNNSFSLLGENNRYGAGVSSSTASVVQRPIPGMSSQTRPSNTENQNIGGGTGHGFDRRDVEYVEMENPTAPNARFHTPESPDNLNIPNSTSNSFDTSTPPSHTNNLSKESGDESGIYQGSQAGSQSSGTRKWLNVKRWSNKMTNLGYARSESNDSNGRKTAIVKNYMVSAGIADRESGASITDHYVGNLPEMSSSNAHLNADDFQRQTYVNVNYAGSNHSFSSAGKKEVNVGHKNDKTPSRLKLIFGRRRRHCSNVPLSEVDDDGETYISETSRASRASSGSTFLSQLSSTRSKLKSYLSTNPLQRRQKENQGQRKKQQYHQGPNEPYLSQQQVEDLKRAHQLDWRDHQQHQHVQLPQGHFHHDNYYVVPQEVQWQRYEQGYQHQYPNETVFHVSTPNALSQPGVNGNHFMGFPTFQQPMTSFQQSYNHHYLHADNGRGFGRDYWHRNNNFSGPMNQKEKVVTFADEHQSIIVDTIVENDEESSDNIDVPGVHERSGPSRESSTIESNSISFNSNDSQTIGKEHVPKVLDLPWHSKSFPIKGRYSGPINQSLQPHGEGTLILQGSEFLTLYGVWDKGRLVSPLSSEQKKVHQIATKLQSLSRDEKLSHERSPSKNSSQVKNPAPRINQHTLNKYIQTSSMSNKNEITPIQPENTPKPQQCLPIKTNYGLGDVARSPLDMLMHRSNGEAIYSASLLKLSEKAFIKRTNGLWTCAILAARGMQPVHKPNGQHIPPSHWYANVGADSDSLELEESMLFVINEDGATKIIQRLLWGKFVRRLKPLTDKKEVDIIPADVVALKSHKNESELKDGRRGRRPVARNEHMARLLSENTKDEIDSGTIRKRIPRDPSADIELSVN